MIGARLMIQGELAFRARVNAPQPCIRQVRRGILTMMQSYASAAKLRAAGPFSKAALNAMACNGWPPPRIVIGTDGEFVRLRELVVSLLLDRSHHNADRHLTGGHQAP